MSVDVFKALAATLPAGSIQWRQDGKPSLRDGRWFARFVAYVEANTVRERLDGVVPGEWDLTLDLLPPLQGADAETAAASFKATLKVLGCERSDVGTGRDYKAASTDAFKRAAVRFGIAHELYDYEQNWVQVDGDSRFAKPLEDPQTAYNRRYSGKADAVGVAAAARENGDRGVKGVAQEGHYEPAASASPAPVLTVSPTDTLDGDAVPCPKCGGRTWDNRVGKRNPKAPDFKCRDKSCDGVVWPPKVGRERGRGGGREAVSLGDMPELDGAPLMTGADDLPF